VHWSASTGCLQILGYLPYKVIINKKIEGKLIKEREMREQIKSCKTREIPYTSNILVDI